MWHLVRCRPHENASPDEMKRPKTPFASPKHPIIERFEWGRMDNKRIGDTHVFLVTFKDRTSLAGTAGRDYREALAEAHTGYLRGGLVEYVVHDATPHARHATRRHCTESCCSS